MSPTREEIVAALKRATDDAAFRRVDMDDLDAACQNRDDAALLDWLAARVGNGREFRPQPGERCANVDIFGPVLVIPLDGGKQT